MNTPIGPESEATGGPSNQIVAQSDGVIANSAWSPPAPMWLDGAPGEEGIDFSVFLHCLRRKWLPGLLIGSLLAAIVSGLLFFLIPVSFQAISLLRVKRSEPNVMRKIMSSDLEYMAYKQTQATLVTSPFVLNAALRKPGVMQLSMMRREAGRELDWLTREVDVMYPGDSEIMQVGMSGDNTDDIKKIVDAVVEAYLYEIGQSEKTEKSRQLQTLQTQQRRNEQLIKEKSEIINRLAEQFGSSDSDTARLKSQLEQDQLRSLSRQRTVAQEELARLMSEQYSMGIVRQGAQFYKPDPKDLELALQRDPLYAQAMQNIAGIEQVLSTMQAGGRASLGMNNPYQAEYIAAQQALAKRKEAIMPLLEHQLKQEFSGNENGSATAMQVIQGQVAFKKKQLEAIQKQYNEQLDRVANLSGFSADLIAKKNELRTLQGSTDEMGREISRLQVELLAENRIQRVQPATIPNEGSYFLKMIEVVGGGLLTLFGTLLAITLWDYKAKRLNSTNEVQDTLRIPVIGTIPSLRSGFGSMISGRAASEGVIADSIDSIRAAILYGGQGKELRSVLVTSAVGHEGKSTVASQLSVSLARAGRRTLLVDADIRNPQQHAVFGLPLDRGLCDVIRGQATVEEVVQATPAEGLWILPAGRFDMAVMQAMSGPAFSEMMDRLHSQFDFVILDSGPVLTGPGAMICGQHVDAAVISTRRDISRLPKIDEACKRLQSVGIFVLGSVVNGTSSDIRSNQLSVAAAS